MGLVHSSFIAFPVPRNLNYLWTFGAILAFMLIAQIVTGVVLAMHYVPSATAAFQSIEHIMRDVNYGWLIRYMHTNGASLFFLAVLHPHVPRPLLRLLQAAARSALDHRRHHLLPDDRDRLPRLRAAVGRDELRRRDRHHEPRHRDPGGRDGDRALAVGRFRGRRPDPQPLLLAALPAAVHHRRLRRAARLGAARRGQNNPDGVEVQNVERDTVAFTPYATIKDIFAVSVWFILYAWLIFFIPNYLLDADNYNIANPLVTPAHVVPEWYLLPFYAILRAIPNKLMGVVALFASIVVLAFVPVARPQSGQVGEISSGLPVLLLGVRGDLRRPRLDRIAGAGRHDDDGRAHSRPSGYFGFFLVIMPVLSFAEKTRPIPASIADAVLAKKPRPAE